MTTRPLKKALVGLVVSAAVWTANIAFPPEQAPAPPTTTTTTTTTPPPPTDEPSPDQAWPATIALDRARVLRALDVIGDLDPARLEGMRELDWTLTPASGDLPSWAAAGTWYGTTELNLETIDNEADALMVPRDHWLAAVLVHEWTHLDSSTTEWWPLDEQEAFAYLRRAARSSGRRLADVAREMAAGQPLPRGRTRPPT